MAKKDKKGFRIPKEIGGIKVPKEARRAGEALIEKVNTPEGRQVLASGLAMAATAAAAIAAKQARGPAPTAGHQAEPGSDKPGPDKPGHPGTTGTVDPQQMVDMLGQAASAFMTRMFGAR